MYDVKEVELQLQQFAQLLRLDIRERLLGWHGVGAAARLDVTAALQDDRRYFADVFVRTLLAGKESEEVEEMEPVEVKHYADWWSAFKERWLPTWWLRKWPPHVITHRIHRKKVVKKITAVCPHLDCGDQTRCIRFLLREKTEPFDPYPTWRGR